MGATTPQLATVRPRMFEPVERRDADGRFERATIAEARPSLVRPLRRVEESRGWRLDEADVVIGVGAVVGADGLRLVEELAEKLGAAVGGDHEACRRGMLPWNRQIGLLGRPVAPRLYLAVCASGGFEHLTGSVKSQVVAAVDFEPDSPLLAAADVGLAGDWRELLPRLVERLDGSL
jgi:electron transfer flavoprotein alpha subunit